MTDIDKIRQYLGTARNVFTDLSDEIWDHPELSYEEHYSSQALIEVLSANGFEIEKGIADIATAFKASFGSGSPVVGFLAEYDALAGLSQYADIMEKKAMEEGKPGHGCGHNAIGASCAAAACNLKQILADEKLNGTIIVFGCPAEEQGCGKAFMMKAGVFDELDIAIAPHPNPTNIITGTPTLANIQAEFSFTGLASHAAAAPEKGRSALDAAELMIMGIQFLREHIDSNARIHYAYLDAGGNAPNVVQATAKLLFYIRSPYAQLTKDLYTRVAKIAQGAALMTDTGFDHTIISAMREFVPNKVLGKLAEESWREMGPCTFSKEALQVAEKMASAVGNSGKKQDLLDLSIPVFAESDSCLLASTDVGDVSIQIPTLMLWFAAQVIGTPAHSWQAVAQGKSALMHEALLHISQVMTKIALEVIRHPEIAQQAKEELSEKTGRSYISLIP